MNIREIIYMESFAIEEVKKGELIALRPGGKSFVKGDYNRSLKKYEVTDYNDISNFKYLKKGRIVFESNN
ncbi:MAG: hypothetical protein RL728_1137 [Bacteroidota bacterium]|jgi:hypothetical protein